MKKSILKKYANLAIKKGVNLQKGQDLILWCNVEVADFAALCVEEAYKAGARRVFMRWDCDPITKVTYNKASIKNLSAFTPWEMEKLKYESETLPCLLKIKSSDPSALDGINQKKVAQVSAESFKIIKPFREIMENKYQWCIIGAATPGWAKHVFPNLPKGKAVEALWQAIIKASRVTDDPIAEWDSHNKDLQARCKYLNDLGLVELRYKSSNGTDFKVGLIEDCDFLGGAEVALGSGIVYNPNIPSEEVFTSPMKGKAEGLVVSTKPLQYNGQLIDKFSIRFEGGKAVEVHAEKNEELLKQMISMDENAGYLGECALIPFKSPINDLGILFSETLYDENASCHLALGRGFTNLIRGYENYTKDELIAKGINTSMIHVDFMIGSPDMDIKGVTKDGKIVQIFKDGNWAF